MSLCIIGTPCSGPVHAFSRIARSAARADCSAASRSTQIVAFSSPLTASMLRQQASSNSIDVASPFRTASAASTSDRSARSVIPSLLRFVQGCFKTRWLVLEHQRAAQRLEGADRRNQLGRHAPRRIVGRRDPVPSRNCCLYLGCKVVHVRYPRHSAPHYAKDTDQTTCRIALPSSKPMCPPDSTGCHLRDSTGW